MTLIKITRGSYGLYENNSVVAKTSDDKPFEVSKAEAERLVKLEVAEIVNDKPEPKKSDDDVLAYDKSMKMAALSEIALKYGVDNTALEACTKKQEIIDLIDEKRKETDEEEAGDDDDTETPDFGAGDGVVS